MLKCKIEKGILSSDYSFPNILFYNRKMQKLHGPLFLKLFVSSVCRTLSFPEPDRVLIFTAALKDFTLAIRIYTGWMPNESVNKKNGSLLMIVY